MGYMRNHPSSGVRGRAACSQSERLINYVVATVSTQEPKDHYPGINYLIRVSHLNTEKTGCIIGLVAHD